MKFSELSKEEQKDLAEYGEIISKEMEAKSEPNPGDPTLDSRWDPSRELSRLNYRRQHITQTSARVSSRRLPTTRTLQDTPPTHRTERYIRPPCR